ncbi:AfsR/SARP family transcriptional regulator [Cellulomonas sp.]|uniref:AfsR/SARP family transcriptional regulator n=1 Tax=Cellulomonas sp. TaxID=40001 RepID=UPI002D32394C|nr:BTAD domain-containing putative transcriptional regulator [Cellulomonas sp.]HYQ74978.1 BTAD domain-containing putative transcriptional regulator [Cellulomonas sp.]
MRYGVLGPVELVTAEGAEPVRGSRQRALLAVLLAHRGALVPRERLIAALWPAGPPPSAEHTLHSHASRIRALVGADLRAVPGGYRLDPQDLDADRFDRAVRAVTRGSARGRPDAARDAPGAGAEVLAEALALWRGPAFGSEADLPEVQAEAERLETARRSAHEALARALVGTDPERAAEAAERALDGDPYREGAWALLVRARTAEGRPGEAVLAYLRAAAALDEIGLLPSQELREAHAGALAAGRPVAPAGAHRGSSRPGAGTRARADGLARRGAAGTGPRTVPPPAPGGAPGPAPAAATAAADAPPRARPAAAGPSPAGPSPAAAARDSLRADGHPPPPLPRPRTSFVGREAELRAARALLAQNALVTFVGPGGVGKTRLALESAARATAPLVPRFVELAAVRDPAAVATAIAQALDADPADPPAQVLARAGTRPAVLVLDNCEHVAGAVAECVDLLLSEPGPLRVLATSRTPLGVAGEHVLLVEPLGTDGPRSAAARLFRDRARAASGRATGPDPAAADPAADPAAADPGAPDPVARIVARLDGLPLAVEMAAARTATLSVADLADLLDARLDSLVQPRRDAPARHRSLAALVGWSRELLGRDARTALDGWPVFATACPPDLAARVLDVPARTAEQLAAASLLVRDDARGRTRYRMLQTVRAVVGPPPEPVRARHAAVLLDVARDADRALRGPGEPEARARLTALLPDLRVAHAWAATHDPDLAVRLTRALHRHAVDALRTDVLAWPVPGREDAPAVLAALAARALVQGHRGGAGRRAHHALAGAADAADRLHALEVLADLALFEGRTDDAVALGGRIAAEAQHAADPHYRVIGLTYPALVAAYRDRPLAADAALAVLRRAVHPVLAAPSDRAWLAFTTGEVLARTDPAAAVAALADARELAESVGDRYLSGVARAATVAAVARRPDPAGALDELLALARDWAPAGDRTHLLTALRNAVPLLLRLDRPEEAALLLGAVTAPDLPVTYGVEADALAGARAGLAAALGAPRLAALVDAGADDDLGAAVDRLAAPPAGAGAARGGPAPAGAARPVPPAPARPAAAPARPVPAPPADGAPGPARRAAAAAAPRQPRSR